MGDKPDEIKEEIKRGLEEILERVFMELELQTNSIGKTIESMFSLSDDEQSKLFKARLLGQLDGLSIAYKSLEKISKKDTKDELILKNVDELLEVFMREREEEANREEILPREEL